MEAEAKALLEAAMKSRRETHEKAKAALLGAKEKQNDEGTDKGWL